MWGRSPVTGAPRRLNLGIVLGAVFFCAMAAAVASPLYGRWLLDHSPGHAVVETGEVVRTVLTSRRGSSAAFFITMGENAIWWGLTALVWGPLAGALVFCAITFWPGWRGRQ